MSSERTEALETLEGTLEMAEWGKFGKVGYIDITLANEQADVKWDAEPIHFCQGPLACAIGNLYVAHGVKFRYAVDDGRAIDLPGTEQGLERGEFLAERPALALALQMLEEVALEKINEFEEAHDVDFLLNERNYAAFEISNWHSPYEHYFEILVAYEVREQPWFCELEGGIDARDPKVVEFTNTRMADLVRETLDRNFPDRPNREATYALGVGQAEPQPKLRRLWMGAGSRVVR